MRIFRYFFYIIILFITTVIFLGIYADHKLSTKDYSDAYNDCRKVWTSRGLYGKGIDQNSIESIDVAFNEGAMGVEVDIRYDLKLKDYIVSHDYPYNMKNGKILYLSELFDEIGDDHYFWLDFKRLRHMNKQQALGAVDRLIEISRKNDLFERIYVEGENPTNLAHFRAAGFHTIFDTHPLTDDNFFSSTAIFIYKILFYFGDHTVMGMEYGSLEDPVYGPKTKALLGGLPVFLYHLPVDKNIVEELLKQSSVRAFIVGNNQSVNFHYMNNCH